MKKLIIVLLICFVSSTFISIAQNQATSSQFTKAELLAFKNVNELLSAINKGQDYSKYLVQNFTLTTSFVKGRDIGVKISKTATGGTWNKEQISMIERYAKKGAVFILENIVLIELENKDKINQPNVSFSVKE